MLTEPPAAPSPSEEDPWRHIGPSNFAGRITSLVCDPENTETIYAGSAGGGVWRSRDAGKTWESLWDGNRDMFPVLSVGALAIARDDKVGVRLYCGTGEANLSSDNYPGIGVLKFKGEWSRPGFPAKKETSPSATRDIPVFPPRIGAIAVDPDNPDRILIGGVRHSDEYQCGMFELNGEDWIREPKLSAQISKGNYYCHSIVIHPERKVFFATVDARGLESGIWRRDGMGEWQHLTTGLPPGDQFARTSLAIARSNGKVIYALAANRTGGVLGVFRSEDEGDHWNEIGNGRFGDEGQMSYNNCIAVHPEDPDFVIWGGLELHRTKDGGKTWEQVSRSNLSSREKGSPRYVHQDHHALLMVQRSRDSGRTLLAGDRAGVSGRTTLFEGTVSGAPKTATLKVSIQQNILIYDGNDSGVSVSEDGGDTWNDRSTGMDTTMFYDVDVAQGDSKGRVIAGGTQDNGTLMTDCARLPHKATPLHPPAKFSRRVGGDGGWVVYDPKDATHFYASAQRMHIYRRRVGARLRDVTPAGLTADERAAIWMAFIDMDPEDPRTVFTASDRVWRTLDDGKSWRASRSLDGSPVSALEVARKNRRRIYAGTENGGFFRSRDGGDTWSQNMAGALLPGRIITRIETHPNDEDVVYVTVGAVGTVVRYQGRDDSSRDKSALPVASPATIRFSHVFRSPDGGAAWKDADPDSKLPNVPHLALAFETDSPHRLFVAGDVSVYMLDETGLDKIGEWRDKTGQWRQYTDNLPSVIVTDLVYHQSSRTLTAATYGRGLWSRYVT